LYRSPNDSQRRDSIYADDILRLSEEVTTSTVYHNINGNYIKIHLRLAQLYVVHLEAHDSEFDSSTVQMRVGYICVKKLSCVKNFMIVLVGKKRKLHKD